MTDYIYASNTLASSGNQYYFETDARIIQKGRVFYKLACGGRYKYSLLFTNIIDSTYSDGSKSRKNLVCGEWVIHKASVAQCKKDIFDRDFLSGDGAQDINAGIGGFKQLTFNGNYEKAVTAGEVFYCDSFEFTAEKDEYLCFEMEFSGAMLPYHEESIIPIFKCIDGKWIYDKTMPLPACVGCDRSVKAKIGFLGDSITQGIGTEINSYKHWNALIAEKHGTDYSYWNLGIGFGRANDAADKGIWLKKALMNDIVFVCFGVNDILQGFGADDVKRDLDIIADTLLGAGKTVVFQTLPPFNYWGDLIGKWQEINRYIKEDIAKRAAFVFDCVPILGEGEFMHCSKYGGHPNETGCGLWADALYRALTEAKVL